MVEISGAVNHVRWIDGLDNNKSIQALFFSLTFKVPCKIPSVVL